MEQIVSTSDWVQKRNLGRTDIKVTPIGLGGNKFGEAKSVLSRLALPGLIQEEMNQIIKAALNGGINWFDTAEMYGFGASEQGISRALSEAGVEDGWTVWGQPFTDSAELVDTFPGREGRSHPGCLKGGTCNRKRSRDVVQALR